MKTDKKNVLTGDLLIGDEVAQSVEQFDWANTALGSISSWNAGLQSAVRLCLHSKSPILIVGGEDLIQIYNSAFAKIIGSRHPQALGAKAKDCWNDRWEELGKVADNIWRNGESVLLENHRFVKHRNGIANETYFTSSFTPIFDDTGMQGIMVSITETTFQIRNHEHLKKLRNQLVTNLFIQAPIAFCLLRGPELILDVVNEAMLRLWGKTSEQVLNQPIFTGLSDARHQGFEELLEQVLSTGKRLVFEEAPVVLSRHGKPDNLIVKLVFEPLHESDGSVSGIMVIADEITEQVNSRKRTEESEIRQKLAIEAAAIGTFDWNMSASIFQYSDRLAQMFGYLDSTGLTQNSFVDRIHPDDMAMRKAAHELALTTGSLFYEARVVWPDRSVHWVQLNGKVIFDRSGKGTHMYGTTLDVTDQRTATERLEELVRQRTNSLEERNTALMISEQRYHKMIEEVQDYAIILIDRDGIIQNWNRGAEHIKGYRENDVVGKHFEIFHVPEEREHGLPGKLIQEALANSRATNEGWRVRKDGSQFWASVVITALHDDADNTIGFTKVTRDLTERKVAEEKMMHYTLELEAQNRELEQFAYIASHDLQEPLRKIRTFTELVQQNINNEPAASRYFDKINASAHRMSELIKSVLAYSRIAKEADQFVAVDLNVILDHVLTDFELLIEEKKATIQATTLPVVHGVESQLGQLFSNLISNSLKFSTRAPILNISTRILTQEEINENPALLSHAPYTELTFSDNGIGFDQQYEMKIFTMFQRLNRKEQYAGTGIGLALCKKIVDNHNGAIAAKGNPGYGATFTVCLPMIG